MNVVRLSETCLNVCVYICGILLFALDTEESLSPSSAEVQSYHGDRYWSSCETCYATMAQCSALRGRKQPGIYITLSKLKEFKCKR